MKRTRTYIPTYDEAVQMCNGGNKKNAIFYENKYVVDNYNVSVFNYRLAQFTDFTNPIKGKDYINGYEMRGLTYVFNEDGSVFKRYLLLEKFFNLNQVTESMYNVVKDYEIKYINNKEDGSIASFIKLPNGKVVGKSKMSFESDQAFGINKIYNTNEEVKKFVDWTLDNDITAIFEYVSPHNRIVLRYTGEELILLKMRDNNTGKHLDISNYLDKIGNIKVANFEEKRSLDELIELMKVEENKEGYVIHSIDNEGNDFFYKMKTEWYRNLHSIYTNDLYHEDKLIKLIIDEKIDDIIGELKDDDSLRKKVDDIILIIRMCITENINRIQDLYNVYKKLNSIKEFAIKYHNDEYFSDTMKYIKNNDISLEDLVKERILKKTNRLEKAREFIKREFIKSNKTIQ
jgi:T4 RnlA family RNA ligase